MASSTATAETILITGANRGIGLCILRGLASTYPQNNYFLGARSEASGAAALSSLREAGIEAAITVLPIDVSSNTSLIAAAAHVRETSGKLDVLVNNAGIATRSPLDLDLSDPDALDRLRASWSRTFDTNVFGVALACAVFTPLLAAAPAPRIINISSGRASLTNSTTGNLPPTQVVAYSASKVALNGLGTELEKMLRKELGKDKGRVWSVTPGHCKTEFNGYRGTRDPMDGAGVVVELLRGDHASQRPSGFWQEEGGVLSEVPW